jgi:hypothetical protein
MLVLLLLIPATMLAQKPLHEIRIYSIASMHPIRWDNPSTLYKTAKHCFYKTATLKDNYLLGHMIVCLNSPLLPQKRYLAMTAANKRKQVELILKDKIGLAILGATLEGELESEAHMQHMVQVYTQRHKVAYLSFLVSESAMVRILDFVEQFSRKIPGEIQPSRYYGGFYWPLYENEGAGCSAFALGMLAAASLLPAEASEWLKNVKVPMTLIGGEYRANKRIPFGRIRRSKTWYEGEGLPNVDFVNVQTYDPTALFDWILKRRSMSDTIFIPSEQDGLPGLTVDCTNRSVPAENPFFKKRPEPNLFLDVYRKKLLQDTSKQSSE